MGIVKLKWNNLAVQNSLSATGQRISKRLKSEGGSYDTLNFSPANDLAKTVSAATATVLDNKIYQFIVQSLCTFGGPVGNDNGPVEGIGFGCILPVVQSTHSSVSVTVNVANTDIQKARIKIRTVNNFTQVGLLIVARSNDLLVANFTGLEAATNYFVEVEFYAVINGVEIISSNENFLNTVCGGNITGYKVTTGNPPSCPIPIGLQIQSLAAPVVEQIYYGIKTGGAIPDATEVVATGVTTSQDASATVSIPWQQFSDPTKYPWVAIPNKGGTYTKTRYFANDLAQGTIGQSGDVFHAAETVIIGGQSYNVYITDYPISFDSDVLLIP